MNKHMLVLPLLLVSATALLLTSLSLPSDELGPPVLASGTPVPEISSEPSPELSSSPSASNAGPSAEPTDNATASESAEPSAEPSGKASPEPSPSPSSSDLPSYGIAATSPDSVLREAAIHTGRSDPFKNVYPPDLPEFTTALDPEQMALPELVGLPLPMERPTAKPVEMPSFNPVETPEPYRDPSLEQGLNLKGIIGGGIDPIALIEVDGRTELIRVGERLRGNILVTSIHYEHKRVTLSRGQQKGLLVIQSPEKTPF